MAEWDALFPICIFVLLLLLLLMLPLLPFVLLVLVFLPACSSSSSKSSSCQRPLCGTDTAWLLLLLSQASFAVSSLTAVV